MNFMIHSKKNILLNIVYVTLSIFLIYLSVVSEKFNFKEMDRNVPARPLPYLEHLSLGYHENAADSLWLRAIQDFDYCESKFFGQCQSQGWLYQMLLTITKLSPEFKMPMLMGPVMLSVVIGDRQGATLLFDYAVKKFPEDWSIAYRAGYHAMAEEKNNEKAARLMEQAARNGAPDWVYNLATKLYTKAGEREVAIKLFEQLKKSGNFSPALLKEMRTRMGIQE